MAGASRGTLRIGVSACLLGERVRWDGGDKRDDALLAAFGRRVRWVPVCPEMEIGLGAPREPVDLVRTARGVRMRGADSGADHTQAMRNWSAAWLDGVGAGRIHGFVLKSRSPSCGLHEVAVHGRGGAVVAQGRGLFAQALVDRFPDLPVEDEARLRDGAARSRFLRRVRDYARRGGVTSR